MTTVLCHRTHPVSVMEHTDLCSKFLLNIWCLDDQGGEDQTGICWWSCRAETLRHNRDWSKSNYCKSYLLLDNDGKKVALNHELWDRHHKNLEKLEWYNAWDNRVGSRHQHLSKLQINLLAITLQKWIEPLQSLFLQTWLMWSGEGCMWSWTQCHGRSDHAGPEVWWVQLCHLEIFPLDPAQCRGWQSDRTAASTPLWQAQSEPELCSHLCTESSLLLSCHTLSELFWMMVTILQYSNILSF